MNKKDRIITFAIFHIWWIFLNTVIDKVLLKKFIHEILHANVNNKTFLSSKTAKNLKATGNFKDFELESTLRSRYQVPEIVLAENMPMSNYYTMLLFALLKIVLYAYAFYLFAVFVLLPSISWQMPLMIPTTTTRNNNRKHIIKQPVLYLISKLFAALLVDGKIAVKCPNSVIRDPNGRPRIHVTRQNNCALNSVINMVMAADVDVWLNYYTNFLKVTWTLSNNRRTTTCSPYLPKMLKIIIWGQYAWTDETAWRSLYWIGAKENPASDWDVKWTDL